MKSISSDKRIKRLILDSSLVCAALLLSFVEAILPTFALPLPGFKAGFANIAILFSAFSLSNADAAAVSFVRCIMSFLFFGSPTTLMFSLFGGTFVIVGLFILKITKAHKKLSFIGISVMSALLHNLGQLIAAYILMGNAVLAYLPALLIASLIYGTFTGIVLCALPTRLYEIFSRYDKV